MIGADTSLSMAARQGPVHPWLPPAELAPIGVSLLATLVSTFSVIGISFVLLDLQPQLGITTAQVNLLRCTAIASGLLIVFCASTLCRLLGTKRCLAAGLALWIAGCLLLAGHAGLASLATGLVLMGCADGCVRVSSYAMLCGGAADAQQIAVLVAANTLANSLAFVASPILNSWILVQTENSAAVIGGLWGCLFLLTLLLLQVFVRPDRREAAAQHAQVQASDWIVLLAAGGCASLISTLPIIHAFQPTWVPAGMALIIALMMLAAMSLRRSGSIAGGFRFLINPRIGLLLLALAALFSIDYRYCAERFLAIRYQLDLASISAWMTLASLAGIASSFVFAAISSRIGMARSVGLGLLGCLILPITFVMAPSQVPILVIASSTASFSFFLTFVRVGLTSTITAMTDKPLLANLEAVRHVLATSAWSLGSALAVNVLLGTFRSTLEQQLKTLPLSDAVIQTISRLVASGHGREVLEGQYGISRQLLMTVIGRNATPTIEAIMSVLHGMGWLILLMLVLVTVLIALSRRVTVPMLRP
ncbi:MFS transporter [Synechococcus sp. CCY9202]|uniref:MFS transporter n=1 Tax=Synechococcus sp. CCY9202 TaxID=174698 RepID=UPI002B1FDBA3|nr:MFS transporter [Synechococcus sp. CCY9202]